MALEIPPGSHPGPVCLVYILHFMLRSSSYDYPPRSSGSIWFSDEFWRLLLVTDKPHTTQVTGTRQTGPGAGLWPSTGWAGYSDGTSSASVQEKKFARWHSLQPLKDITNTSSLFICWVIKQIFYSETTKCQIQAIVLGIQQIRYSMIPCSWNLHSRVERESTPVHSYTTSRIMKGISLKTIDCTIGEEKAVLDKCLLEYDI